MILRYEKQWECTPPLEELHVKVSELDRENWRGYPADWYICERFWRGRPVAKPSEREGQQDRIDVCVMTEKVRGMRRGPCQSREL